MKNLPFYQVRGTLFRTKQSDENPVIINEIFKDEQPIIAREKAFKCYQNYIDVFAESKGIKSDSFDEYNAKLQDFTNSYSNKIAKVGNVSIGTIDVDFDKGLNVYLVLNDESFITKEGELIYENKKLIHSFDNNFIDFTKEILEALKFEYAIYTERGYSCKKFRREISFKNETTIENIIILDSPLNFN